MLVFDRSMIRCQSMRPVERHFASVGIVSICQTADIVNINVSFWYGKHQGGPVNASA